MLSLAQSHVVADDGLGKAGETRGTEIRSARLPETRWGFILYPRLPPTCRSAMKKFTMTRAQTLPGFR